MRNPPIVAPFSGDTYLHLDGANRITVLNMLGYKNCLVQVVDYSDTNQVDLTSCREIDDAGWRRKVPWRKNGAREFCLEGIDCGKRLRTEETGRCEFAETVFIQEFLEFGDL